MSGSQFSLTYLNGKVAISGMEDYATRHERDTADYYQYIMTDTSNYTELKFSPVINVSERYVFYNEVGNEGKFSTSFDPLAGSPLCLTSPVESEQTEDDWLQSEQICFLALVDNRLCWAHFDCNGNVYIPTSVTENGSTKYVWQKADGDLNISYISSPYSSSAGGGAYYYKPASLTDNDYTFRDIKDFITYANPLSPSQALENISGNTSGNTPNLEYNSTNGCKITYTLRSKCNFYSPSTSIGQYAAQKCFLVIADENSHVLSGAHIYCDKNIYIPKIVEKTEWQLLAGRSVSGYVSYNDLTKKSSISDATDLIVSGKAMTPAEAYSSNNDANGPYLVGKAELSPLVKRVQAGEWGLETSGKKERYALVKPDIHKHIISSNEDIPVEAFYLYHSPTKVTVISTSSRNNVTNTTYPSSSVYSYLAVLCNHKEGRYKFCFVCAVKNEADNSLYDLFVAENTGWKSVEDDEFVYYLDCTNVCLRPFPTSSSDILAGNLYRVQNSYVNLTSTTNTVYYPILRNGVVRVEKRENLQVNDSCLSLSVSFQVADTIGDYDTIHPTYPAYPSSSENLTLGTPEQNKRFLALYKDSTENRLCWAYFDNITNKIYISSYDNNSTSWTEVQSVDYISYNQGGDAFRCGRFDINNLSDNFVLAPVNGEGCWQVQLGLTPTTLIWRDILYVNCKWSAKLGNEQNLTPFDKRLFLDSSKGFVDCRYDSNISDDNMYPIRIGRGSLATQTIREGAKTDVTNQTTTATCPRSCFLGVYSTQEYDEDNNAVDVYYLSWMWTDGSNYYIPRTFNTVVWDLADNGIRHLSTSFETKPVSVIGGGNDHVRFVTKMTEQDALSPINYHGSYLLVCTTDENDQKQLYTKDLSNMSLLRKANWSDASSYLRQVIYITDEKKIGTYSHTSPKEALVTDVGEDNKVVMLSFEQIDGKNEDYTYVVYGTYSETGKGVFDTSDALLFPSAATTYRHHIITGFAAPFNNNTTTSWFFRDPPETKILTPPHELVYNGTYIEVPMGSLSITDVNDSYSDVDIHVGLVGVSVNGGEYIKFIKESNEDNIAGNSIENGRIICSKNTIAVFVGTEDENAAETINDIKFKTTEFPDYEVGLGVRRPGIGSSSDATHELILGSPHWYDCDGQSVITDYIVDTSYTDRPYYIVVVLLRIEEYTGNQKFGILSKPCILDSGECYNIVDHESIPETSYQLLNTRGLYLPTDNGRMTIDKGTPQSYSSDVPIEVESSFDINKESESVECVYRDVITNYYGVDTRNGKTNLRPVFRLHWGVLKNGKTINDISDRMAFIDAPDDQSLFDKTGLISSDVFPSSEVRAKIEGYNQDNQTTTYTRRLVYYSGGVSTAGKQDNMALRKYIYLHASGQLRCSSNKNGPSFFFKETIAITSGIYSNLIPQSDTTETDARCCFLALRGTGKRTTLCWAALAETNEGIDVLLPTFIDELDGPVWAKTNETIRYIKKSSISEDYSDTGGSYSVITDVNLSGMSEDNIKRITDFIVGSSDSYKMKTPSEALEDIALEPDSSEWDMNGYGRTSITHQYPPDADSPLCYFLTFGFATISGATMLSPEYFYSPSSAPSWESYGTGRFFQRFTHGIAPIILYTSSQVSKLIELQADTDDKSMESYGIKNQDVVNYPVYNIYIVLVKTNLAGANTHLFNLLSNNENYSLDFDLFDNTTLFINGYADITELYEGLIPVFSGSAHLTITKPNNQTTDNHDFYTANSLSNKINVQNATTSEVVLSSITCPKVTTGYSLYVMTLVSLLGIEDIVTSGTATINSGGQEVSVTFDSCDVLAQAKIPQDYANLPINIDITGRIDFQ